MGLQGGGEVTEQPAVLGIIMTRTEQPLVGIGEVASFLKVCEKTAAAMIKRCRTPLLPGYGRTIAVLPSVLVESLKMVDGKNHTENP